MFFPAEAAPEFEFLGGGAMDDGEVMEEDQNTIGTGTDTAVSTSPLKVRTLFPETWLWTEDITGYS